MEISAPWKRISRAALHHLKTCFAAWQRQKKQGNSIGYASPRRTLRQHRTVTVDRHVPPPRSLHAMAARWPCRKHATKKPDHTVAGLGAGGNRAQVSMSAQMLRDQLYANVPSVRLAAGDRPPEPGTVSIVFCAAS